MVGADVPGRPPPARTGTTPEDDASARAAEDVGPYQRRTPHDTQRRALTARAEPHTSCGAQGRIHMVGADVPGRPPPAQGRRRWTMRPRGPPRTSAPTNAAQPWRAEPHTSCGTQDRIHGRGGRPRPPAPRTGTTPVDDASTRAAEDVGPYQHRTAVACRTAHTSCGAQDDDAHDTLTDAGSLRPSDD